MTDILIVDDDHIMQTLLGNILKDLYEIHSVGSGEEALAFLSEKTADLVLLDIKMPGMDGFETIKHIREIDSCRGLPIIFLTGDEDKSMEVSALRAGGTDFIRKPFLPEVVKLRVSHIIELHRLRDHLEEEVEIKTAEVHRSEQKIRSMSVEITQALSGTIDAKDEYTNGHSRRVAKYSMEIAKRFGYSLEEQQNIYLIGLLHDIGKIGVPDEIIRMPRKLTDEEFAIIKNHPVIGAAILSNIKSFPNISAGAHWHHERYDGGGYPDGLKGEEIPEVARIIAVADAYDAMTSNRSYRSYLPQEKVRSEIERGRGSQFDPVFADIMLAMIDEDTEYSMQEDN